MKIVNRYKQKETVYKYWQEVYRTVAVVCIFRNKPSNETVFLLRTLKKIHLCIYFN